MARRRLDITEEDKAEMLRMYMADNFGISEIAKSFTDKGKLVSSSTVSRVLKAKGATLRNRGTRLVKETNVSPLENHSPLTFSLE